MLNIAHTLLRLEIRDTAQCAIIDVRERIEAAPASKQVAVAETLVQDLLGVTVRFEDFNQALFTTQAIVDTAIRNGCEVEDGEIALQAALRRAEAFMTKPENKWMFAVKAAAVDDSVQEQVSTMTDTKVAVKADGTIKKGGRQVLAQALYKQYVIDAAEKPTNSWFKELLVKELGMTSAGASTYAYNCDSELQLLVKASKGGAKKKG